MDTENTKKRKPTLVPKQEAFAQALAGGAEPKDAFRMAGYKGRDSNALRVLQHPKVVDRVAELTAEHRWGGSADLAPVINELMSLAQEAGKLKTAAGMNAARGLLAEAAKLKLLLPSQASRRRNWDDVIPPRMSQEEWIRTYAVPD